jgi:pyridoxal phosphate enzyme (YggS family)
MSVADKINKLKKELPANCTLVAVSKTKPSTMILDAYQGGHRDFGENKVQELVNKYEELPKDIQWHMIGHLQRNKVKYIAPFVHLIHGVDSAKLLQEIQKQGEKNNRIIDCLLQVHIAAEETKFGFDRNELLSLIQNQITQELGNVRIVGLMGMATFTEDEEQVATEFKGLKSLFEEIKISTLPSNFEMRILSMGMSGDFNIAIQEGSNMVRVGSLLFGERNY